MNKASDDIYTSFLKRDAWLGSNDSDFDEFVNSMPTTHWAKYDLSAVRLGWEAYKSFSILETTK